MANEKKFRNGPSTFDSGPTHASVSDRTIDDDAIISMVLAVDMSLFSDILSSSCSSIIVVSDNGAARRAVGVLMYVGGNDVVIFVGTMRLADAADENDDVIRRVAKGGVKLIHDDANRTNVTTATCIAVIL
jgi:hypothetical protein